MGKCKHAWLVFYADSDSRIGTATVSPLGWRCASCGEYKALGPARDGGEHAAQVAIEVRAAEIAEQWHDADPAVAFDFVRRLDNEESRGWSIAETNMQNHTDRWHAGYLARCITTGGES